jgi:uncharacterized surface protein with fasciclin (FAS1) repeats
MRVIRRRLAPVVSLSLLVAACSQQPERPAPDAAPPLPAGQTAVVSQASQKTVARIAMDSPDHTTLVAALEAVGWLDALASPGPFTVFAPVNAAFDKLPPGTVETLLRPENAGQLRTILLHHVLATVYEPADLTDGTVLAMLAGGPATVQRVGDDVLVDGARVVAVVRGGNGIVYVVDSVLLPREP